MRSEKVQIGLIYYDKKVKDIVKAIYIQNTFLFIYDKQKSAKVKDDYPDLGYDVDDFKTKARIAVEFQLVSRNFKKLKKIDVIKAYFFHLLGVYLINKPTSFIISTLEK